MMQQTLFELAAQWPDGWSAGAVVDEKSSNVLGLRRHVIEYAHSSGAKLRTSQKWELDTGRCVHTSYRVWLTEEEWSPYMVNTWSFLVSVRPGRSEDWDCLMRRREPSRPSPARPMAHRQWVFIEEAYGQWVFIEELIGALRAREMDP